MLEDLLQELQQFANPTKAAAHLRFFKTKKGEYGSHEQFIGLTVPQQRTISTKYKMLPLQDLQKLITSRIHEYRLTALFILAHQFKSANELNRKQLYDFYMKNCSHINNWDLVDESAPRIVGRYLLDKKRDILYTFAESDNLWKKRIAIISTLTFIKNNEYGDTLRIAHILLNDKHDLIHKAVGWMLREVGKRDQSIEEGFLEIYSKQMPRTMLRYAIEKFTPEKRAYYMNK